MSALFLGLDLSTQALKASLLDDKLALLGELEVRFDVDLPHYATRGGVLPPQENDARGTVVAPVAMYVEAVDLLAQRFKQHDWPLGRIRGVSAAGQQHASVYFSRAAPELLARLDPSATLSSQLAPAFSRANVPNWQDSSTVDECEEMHRLVGGPDALAAQTGSKAHTRFTASQILRWRREHPDEYANTERIALVSNFITSLLAGSIAPIDESDACGMNLWCPDSKPQWYSTMLELVGGDGGQAELARKLGIVEQDASEPVASIAPWWVTRYGFHPDCKVFAGTGDNPATLLAFSLAESEAIVSLGTSDTVIFATEKYTPAPELHTFVHPASTPEHRSYFKMLVFKNGSLAREAIRDQYCQGSWDTFNASLEKHRLSHGDLDAIGFYWFRPEIIPPGASGVHTYVRGSQRGSWDKVSSFDSDEQGRHAAAIVESQFLNYRHRSDRLTRVYAVGGASNNPAICQSLADVTGAPVLKLKSQPNFCSVGAAYKAAWGCLRTSGERLEAFVKRVKTLAQSETETFQPRPDRTAVYDTAVHEWARLETRALRGE